MFNHTFIESDKKCAIYNNTQKEQPIFHVCYRLLVLLQPLGRLMSNCLNLWRVCCFEALVSTDQEITQSTKRFNDLTVLNGVWKSDPCQIKNKPADVAFHFFYRLYIQSSALVFLQQTEFFFHKIVFLSYIAQVRDVFEYV